jgi:rubrerythrin
MSTVFHADEVLQMAAQIERNGGLFYRKAAEIYEEGKELLLEIAAQEDQHLALFEHMRDEYAERVEQLESFDPTGEAAAYLETMANTHVFDLGNSDPSALLKEVKSLNDIIDIAIQAEKDSIAFFGAMLQMVPENMGKEKVNALLNEEMKHILWLVENKTD